MQDTNKSGTLDKKEIHDGLEKAFKRAKLEDEGDHSVGVTSKLDEFLSEFIQ